MNAISELKNQIKVGAFKNKFRLLLTPPSVINLDSKVLDVVVQSFNSPAHEDNTYTAYFRGRKIAVRGERVYSNEFEMNILDDTNLTIRHILELWMDLVDGDSRSEKIQYKGTAKLFQMSPDNQSEVFGYEIYGIFPKRIDPLDWSASAMNEVFSYSVSFGCAESEVIDGTSGSGTQAQSSGEISSVTTVMTTV